MSSARWSSSTAVRRPVSSTDTTSILAGTNNYLGLTFHPDCVRAATEAVERYGTGTTGSRLASGTYPDHAALERELAEFYDARTAMVFTTGYQANVGIISALADRDSVLVLDAQSHASIYDGATLAGATTYRFKHNDVADLDKKLRRLGDKAANALVIVEGIYSMLGDTAPLVEICEVTTRYGAALLVDEAHSFGVLGQHGRGLAEAVGVEDQVDVIVGTFSKSLGCVGGYAVSRKHDLAQLRAAARSYAYSASSSPSVMASARAALKVIRENPDLRERLLSNARVTYGALQQLGFEVGPVVTPIVGVHVRDPDRRARRVAFSDRSRRLREPRSPCKPLQGRSVCCASACRRRTRRSRSKASSKHFVR